MGNIYIMSDIFLKNKNDSKLSDFLDTEAASTSSLPQWLSIVDKQEGGNIDSASSNISEIENQLKNHQRNLPKKLPKEQRKVPRKLLKNHQRKLPKNLPKKDLKKLLKKPLKELR